MKNLYKFSLVITSVFLLASCVHIKKPILDYDKPFLKEHGSDVNKLKKKHEKSMQNIKAELHKNMAETNVENLKSKRIYSYEKPKDYIVVNGKIISNKNGEAEKKVLFNSDPNIIYAENNSGKFDTKERVLFDDIEIPKDKDAKYYNAKYGEKNYKSVNNLDMQESVDYLTVINDTRSQKRKEIVKKQRLIEERKKAEEQLKQAEQTKEKKGFFGFFK